MLPRCAERLLGSSARSLGLTPSGPVAARGNETPTGEFNFTWDPEAASVVLGEAECETKLLTYEPCLDHALDWVSGTGAF